MKRNTKQERIDMVNLIIADIASRGRKFFCNKNTGTVAYLFLKNNRLYYKCEYSGRDLAVCQAGYGKPKHWQHGGTLWGLIKDFKEYVLKGGDTNHNNGYGGLYCAHWGYPEVDMEAIQAKAREIGYLRPIEAYYGKHLPTTL